MEKEFITGSGTPAVPEDKEIGEKEGCGEPLPSERSVRHEHTGHIHAVVTFNFSRSDIVLLTPLIRRLWHTGRTAVCSGIEELEAVFSQGDVLLCNGLSDFFELDSAFAVAEKKHAASTACICISGVRPDSVECARICGADVILAGLENEEELSDCEWSIAAGRRFWSKGSFSFRAPSAKAFAAYYARLSGMERTVCTGLVTGKKYSAVALELGVATATVGSCAERIYRKFGVHSAVDLARLLAGCCI